MIVLRRLLFILLFLLLCPFAIAEFWYAINQSQWQKLWKQPKHVYPPVLKDMLWYELGDDGPQELKALTPTEYMWHMGLMLIEQKYTAQSAMEANRVPSYVARLIVERKGQNSIRYQLDTVFMAIWLSRRFSSDEILCIIWRMLIGGVSYMVLLRHRPFILVKSLMH